jgi:hypothetical protein
MYQDQFNSSHSPGNYPFAEYTDDINHVSLRFTECGPLALSMESNESVPPQHITCIIGTEIEVVLSICYAIQSTQCQFGKMKNLRSLTLLLPLVYAERPSESASLTNSL